MISDLQNLSSAWPAMTDVHPIDAREMKCPLEYEANTDLYAGDGFIADNFGTYGMVCIDAGALTICCDGAAKSEPRLGTADKAWSRER